MKAIILAAGSKNEISDIIGDKPKCLTSIEDMSLLEMQLNTLHLYGIDDISIVRGYKKQLIDIPGLQYYDNDEYEDTNLLYSLFCAEQEMDDDVLILYGDIAYSEEVIERILNAKQDIALGVAISLDEYKEEYISNLELIHFDSQSNVVKIGKQLTNDNISYGQFSGIIKCTQKGIRILKNNYNQYKANYADYKKILLTDLFDFMVNLGVQLQCVIFEEQWIKINSKDDYEKLQNEKFVKNAIGVKTNWAVRSKLYDNIQWVNRDELLENMIELGEITNDSNMLDVGTGTGKIIKAYHKQNPQANYYGIDISKDMMDKIDRQYGFDLQVQDVQDLSCFQDDFFDLVTARMSFHHVPDLKKACSEVYKKMKTGGKFMICEGVSPDKETLGFYKEVFRHKETRHSFLVDDLMNLLVNANFKKVTARLVVLPNMSMNNWLDNSGLPFRNIDIIRKLHFDCSKEIQKSYCMKFDKDDILMDWKFAIVYGEK